MFCPSCRAMMVPKQGKWFCKRCKTECAQNGKEAKAVCEMKQDHGMLVVDEKVDILPKTRAECAKCGHNEAYWILRQTRSADEPETRIYRCVKCSYSWREY